MSRVAQALAEGRIRAGHVYEFTAGATKLGASVMCDLEEILLPVAETADPGVLKDTITQLHEVLHPEDLDKRYAAGMERRDLKAAKCGEGYHVSGFLDIVAGAKFSAWLKDVSAPEYDGDDRTPAQRCVDAFCRVLDQALTLITEQTDSAGQAGQAGSAGHDDTDTEKTAETEPTRDDADTAETAGTAQPQDRPQTRVRRADTRLLVLADLETLLRMPGAQPATLAGYGHIGTQLLDYLTCGSKTSGILTHGLTDGPVPQADVLNVGRTHRLATARQRAAITARQDGVCANPGCGLTYLEIHHVAGWGRDDGVTDLANLVGICTRCHHLVHQHKLIIRPDGAGGHTFHRRNGRIIDDHTRVTKQRTRQIIADIGRLAATGQAPKTPRAPRPRRGRSDQHRRLATHGFQLQHLRWSDLTPTDPPQRT